MRIISKISRTGHVLSNAPHRTTLIVQALPRSTKEAFKKTCIGKETMRDAIIRLMRFYVLVGGKLPDKMPEE